jgi:hypothetical protein
VKFSLRLISSNTTNLLLHRSVLAVSYSKLRSSPSLVTLCLARRCMAVSCLSRGCATPEAWSFLQSLTHLVVGN